MRQLALVMWFFCVTVMVILFYHYRDDIRKFIEKLKEEQGEKGSMVWEHPLVKWSAMIFGIFTAVAWLDMVMWGITSVLPLALFIVVIGGKKGLRDSAHILLLLSAFWVVSRLMFGLTPVEVLNKLDLEFLCSIYGLSPHILQPLLIPLIILFFLGIASLIWKKHIPWGIAALLVATVFPTMLAILFGKEQGTTSEQLKFIANIYSISPDLLRTWLLPQFIMLAIGGAFFSYKRPFAGWVWVISGLSLPLAIAPLHRMYQGIQQGGGLWASLGQYYNIAPESARVMFFFQATIMIFSFVIAAEKKIFRAVILFFVSISLPWIFLYSQKVYHHLLIPLISRMPENLEQMAVLYNRPVSLIRMLAIPMSFFFLVGMALFFKKNGLGMGISFMMLAIFLPWLAEPFKMVAGGIKDWRLEGIAPFYGRSTEQLRRLMVPMTLTMGLGVVAILKQRAFWGGGLVLTGGLMPWLVKPTLYVVSSGSRVGNVYHAAINYYGITGPQFNKYLPAMILFWLAGLSQMTVKNRFFFGFILIGMGIYLPWAWPEIIQNY